MELNELIDLAKRRNETATKILFEQAKIECQSILKTYYSKAIAQGISYEDLNMLVVPAFFSALMKFEDGGLPFFDFVKYIYLMDVQTEIRIKTKHNLITGDVIMFDPNSDATNINLHTKSYDDFMTCDLDYDVNFIIEAIESDLIPGITIKERKILEDYLEGYNLHEISKRLDRDYSETYKSFRRAIQKIRKFLKIF